MPGPQVCVGGFLRVVTRGMAVGGRFPGRRGRRPLRVARGMGGSGSLPLIRPCGATFPQGGRQGLLLAAEGRGGVGAPRPTDGDMETPAGFTRTPVPGPPHGRGRACPARRFAWADVCGWLPGGWVLAGGFAGRRGCRPLRLAREWAAAGACPSSGPAGPPSPKGEGKGCCWRREAAAGWGHPALRMGILKRCGGYADTRSRAAAR